jgi:hypothetical protein
MAVLVAKVAQHVTEVPVVLFDEVDVGAAARPGAGEREDAKGVDEGKGAAGEDVGILAQHHLHVDVP